MRKTVEERFEEKVDKSGECWLWMASCYPTGYGQFNDGVTMVYAHRLAYAWAYGEIPKGAHIDHRCSTRNCVRPAHLRLTTPSQNGQHRRGANRNSATGVRGVSWDKGRRKYRASVKLNRKLYFAGRYDTIEEAEAAVIAKRRELFTHDDHAEWSASA